MESKKQTMCPECWREKLEGCNDTVVQSGPCAFGRCPNDAEREAERVTIQAKTGIPQLYWRRCYGWATNDKGTRYPIMALTSSGHDGVIIVLNSGVLKAKKASSFKIKIDRYYDDRN